MNSASGSTSVVVALSLIGATAGIVMFLYVQQTPTTNAQGEQILFRADTQYHQITVTEAKTIRTLHLRPEQPVRDRPARRL